MSKPEVEEGQWYIDHGGDLAIAVVEENKLQQLWWSKNSRQWVVTDLMMHDGWCNPIDASMAKLIMVANDIPPPPKP